MGWLFSYGPRRAPTVAEELEREALRWDHLPAEQRPAKVAIASGSGVVAFAMRFPKAYLEANPGAQAPYLPEADGSIVAALVFLYKDGAREFGYKDMSEACGPYDPVAASILPHLSRLDSKNGGTSAEYAQAWRDRCKAYSEGRSAAARKAKSLRDGMTVTLARPLKFQGGFEAATFTVETFLNRGARKALFRAPNGQLCRLTREHLASATISG